MANLAIYILTNSCAACSNVWQHSWLTFANGGTPAMPEQLAGTITARHTNTRQHAACYRCAAVAPPLDAASQLLATYRKLTTNGE